MSSANDPAFPEVKTNWPNASRHDTYSIGGLTKREYFAAMAMQGLLACDGEHCLSAALTFKDHCEERSKVAITYADALLAELERTK